VFDLKREVTEEGRYESTVKQVYTGRFTFPKQLNIVNILDKTSTVLDDDPNRMNKPECNSNYNLSGIICYSASTDSYFSLVKQQHPLSSTSSSISTSSYDYDYDIWYKYENNQSTQLWDIDESIERDCYGHDTKGHQRQHNDSNDDADAELLQESYAVMLFYNQCNTK